MIALIDSTNTIVRITESSEGYDLTGLTAQELPADFDPLGPSHVWSGAAWQVNLDVLKLRKWHQAKAYRDFIQWNGCNTPSGVFDSDPESQSKVTGAVTMAQIAAINSQPFSIVWTRHDNTTVTLNAAQMIAAGVAVGVHVATCHAIGAGLREAIIAVTSVEDLDAIDIEGAPWPS